MTVPRVIELCVCFILAFVIITLISFLSLRPVLSECRREVVSEWEAFLHEVGERNKLLPGLIEAVRGFETGHGKLAAQLLEARAVSTRSTDPDKIVTAVDGIEEALTQVEKLVRARPEINRYPPFSAHWEKIVRSTLKVNLMRKAYNNSARLYNRLLRSFPQNILAAAFGFVPINEYAPVRSLNDINGTP
ncbi:MAG: LemA family protein [Desulfomonile sp.]|nr:LemA family protein [Desulfomonile sp.]